MYKVKFIISKKFKSLKKANQYMRIMYKVICDLDNKIHSDIDDKNAIIIREISDYDYR